MTAIAAMATKMRRRGLLAAIVALSALLGLLLAVTIHVLVSPQGAPEPAQATVDIGGPFELATHDGGTLSNADLAGEPFAVFFGFTNCPDVCPTTLWEMSEALDGLGEDADRLRVLFITVDPERDTPEFMARYLQSFDPRIVGLTGSEEEIAEIARSYRAYFEKVPTGDDDYTMNHTALVFLMNGRGEFAGTIAYEEDQQSRLTKLQNLLRS